MDSKTEKLLSALGFDFKVPIRKMMGRGQRVDTLVDRVKEEDRSTIEQLIRSEAERGEGLSKDQFTTQQDMDRFLELGVSFCLKDMGQNGKIFGFLNVYDSPLCRSTRPVMCAGYAILDPAYQASGVGVEVMALPVITSIANGYHGAITRASLVSAGMIVNSKRIDGPIVTGVIPNSHYLGKGCYLEDAILGGEYERGSLAFLQDLVEKKKAVIELPTLKAEVVTDFQSDGSDAANGFLHKLTGEAVQHGVMNGELCALQLAGDKATLVEELFRRAADQGLGFGIDEFDQNGRLNRKFFRYSVTLVASSKTNNAFVGGIVLGPTAVAKSPTTPTLHGYIVVDERHRRMGYGRDILQTFESIAMDLQYTNLMTDVLVDKTLSGVHMLLSNGFYVTGQLPKCAFVKGRGFTDSLLFYKYLNRTNAKL